MMAEAKRVLVVEDDALLAQMLRVLFDSEGLETTVVHNGREALNHLDQGADDPDVILLDLQMPVMDGRSFYKEYRSRGKQTPIIVFSAYDAEGARAELGAEAAMNKPFDPDQLCRMVVQLVNEPAA